MRDAKLQRGSYPQPNRTSVENLFVPTPAGLDRGDRVDVLLDPAGGYIAAIYVGRSGDMLLFRLDDGRTKGHYSHEIALVRKVRAA